MAITYSFWPGGIGFILEFSFNDITDFAGSAWLKVINNLAFDSD
jgi:hypothetical protein